MIKKFNNFNKINESNDSEMHTIELIVGDWGGDGHDKKESFNILSNLTTGEIKKAYQEGCNLIGYEGKGITNYCTEYEDDDVPKGFIQACEDAFYGATWDDPFKEENFEPAWRKEDTHYSMNVDDYVDIYLRTVKLGNPEFIFKYNDSGSSMGIGGYGLFYA